MWSQWGERVESGNPVGRQKGHRKGLGDLVNYSPPQLPQQMHTEYCHLQSSTWNEQGAAEDPRVLQSQSQSDGVQWRVSEGSRSVWAGVGETEGFSLLFSSWLDQPSQAVPQPSPRSGSLWTEWVNHLPFQKPILWLSKFILPLSTSSCYFYF